MAGQRLRSGNVRAMLKFWGINRDAQLTEKPPELIYREFLESIDSATAKKVPLCGYSKKALTTTVSADLMSFTVAAYANLSFLVRATVIASDGVDTQTFTEQIQVALVSKAGAVTRTVTDTAANGAKAVSAGTLTTSWAVSNGGTGTEKLSVTATTSLTPTTLEVHFTVENFFPAPALATPPVFL